jgi:hypothetical protein
MPISKPKEGDLRVFYIPQVPMMPFEYDVPDMKSAVMVLDALVGLSNFEFTNHVKPDYSDFGSIGQWESGQWNDVEEED